MHNAIISRAFYQHYTATPQMPKISIFSTKNPAEFEFRHELNSPEIAIVTPAHCKHLR